MPLPTSCAECAFFQQEGALCRRHAPGTGFEETRGTVARVGVATFFAGRSSS
jgi:hypothetical protein